MMDGFEYLSEYYDEFVGADYDKIADFIHQKIKCFFPKAEYGVDLGCGSGTLTFKLAERGYDMIGIDRSEAMLAQAAAKNTDEKQVLFLQQDLTEIDLYGAADFMVSSLDCINYLSDIDEVSSFLQHCSTFLNPNGLLIFDFNTLHKYAQVLDGHNFVYEAEGAFCVWENEFDGQNMHYDLTYFVNSGENYKRYEEYQRQTYFSKEQIFDLLKQFDFEILSIEDDYEERSVNDQTQRIVLTAQKRSNK